ncbi:MAG: hypothetical protein ACK559_29405 [bacterium]
MPRATRRTWMTELVQRTAGRKSPQCAKRSSPSSGPNRSWVFPITGPDRRPSRPSPRCWLYAVTRRTRRP